MTTIYYGLTTNELLIFCTACTLLGCLMTVVGIRLSGNELVRKIAKDLIARAKRV